ncbi:DUF1772 domain-containing protein [Saccharomonospora sp. NPDC006951]
MTDKPRSTVYSRLSSGLALVLTGLLAGAFFYGWAVEAPTFADVPMDVHLSYRVQLMDRNGLYMPFLGIASGLALIWTAITFRGSARWFAAAAAVSAVTSQLVTRFGNVPINGEVRQWKEHGPPADFQDRLDTWWMFHDLRFALAAGALVLIVLAVDRNRRSGRSRQETTAEAVVPRQ